MVGRAVTEQGKAGGDEVFGYDHGALDISNCEQVEREVDRISPDAVINCAAWTDVDGCELDPVKADAANALGPENLAKASHKAKAAFVTVSTDYVFAGDKEGFYTQLDQPLPISIYGRSKLEGENRARLANPESIIVRTGFIFGPGGRNFLSKVSSLVRRAEPVTAIADSWGTPTYSSHLAARLLELARLGLPGIYHVVNEGPGAAYDEFVRAVAEELGADQSLVRGVLSATLNRPAPRPRNSRLRCLISKEAGLEPLPDWRAAIREFLFQGEIAGT
jgi:dTDP-4-dehydrorhamnose reductase